MNASKAGKAYFAQAPKVLNAVDVVAASCKLVVPMSDAVMSFISKIGEAVMVFRGPAKFKSILFTLSLLLAGNIYASEKDVECPVMSKDFLEV